MIEVYQLDNLIDSGTTSTAGEINTDELRVNVDMNGADLPTPGTVTVYGVPDYHKY